MAEVRVARQMLAQEAVAAAPYDIRRDDCIRFLRGLADESVDLIVTDPAYSGMNQHMQFDQRDLPDVWAIKRLARAPYPTQKPVALFERMLAGSAEPGFLVCDPFVGSGSAAIAALRNGCHFVGADIADRAVTMARARCAAHLAEGVDPLEPGAGGGPPG